MQGTGLLWLGLRANTSLRPEQCGLHQRFIRAATIAAILGQFALSRFFTGCVHFGYLNEHRMRGNRTLQVRALLAACVGVAAWSGPFVLIPLSLALPLLCHWPSENINWRCRSFVAFVYYAAALWPVTAAGVQLYGFAAIPFLLVVTVIVAGLLAAAWGLRFTVLALILTAVPPIGIFGVAIRSRQRAFFSPVRRGLAWL